MIYGSANEWNNAKNKKVLLFGMSGLGKTYLSNLLRTEGDWFHYSIDYRIGTRYMGDHIVDNVKSEAMKTPFLANLLKSDSIYIRSNITFDNLAPLSTYLGQPGGQTKGGLSFKEYQNRQNQHRKAEKSALLDTSEFINKSQSLYGYSNFVCDSSGSICEVVDGKDPNDPILEKLSKNLLMVWIKGDKNHSKNLIDRFKKNPKPMYYNHNLLEESWTSFKDLHSLNDEEVEPREFAIYAYEKAINARQPKYEAISQNWGISLATSEVSNIKSCSDFNSIIARTLA
jgi:hypothetical protein